MLRRVAERISGSQRVPRVLCPGSRLRRARLGSMDLPPPPSQPPAAPPPLPATPPLPPPPAWWQPAPTQATRTEPAAPSPPPTRHTRRRGVLVGAVLALLSLGGG